MVLATRQPKQTYSDVAMQIEKIAAGDPRAQDWFYRRYSGTLYRRIRHRFGPDRSIDSDELLHDLFVWCLQDNAKILSSFAARNRSDDRTEFRLEGYLWGLVSGLVANQRRAKRRNEDPVALESIQEPAGSDFDAESTDRDSVVRLSDCLKQRGTRLYLYFLLRFVEGLTPDEIGTVTGWPRPKTYKLKAVFNQAVRHCVEVLGLQ